MARPAEVDAAAGREGGEEVLQDVVSALLNLGYSRAAAAKAAAGALRSLDGRQDFEAVIKQALRLLAEAAKG